MKKNIFPIILLFVISGGVMAQKSNPIGEIKNEDFVFEKDRKIVMPTASRIFDKINSTKASTEQNQIEYKFVERKLAIPQTKFNPTLNPLEMEKKIKEGLYENYVKIGAGNYGRYFGEGFVSKSNEDGNVVAALVKHNSTQLGPVDAQNSGTSQQNVKLLGKYLTPNFKLDANLFFDRNQFYFYGYRNRPNISIERDSIKQVLNKYGAEIGIDNTNKEALIDYQLKTKVSFLKDKFFASEIDWKSNLYGSFRITETFVSLLNAEASISQRVDGQEGTKNNRNFFKVKPSFVFSNNFLNITFGINAVLETDNANGLNRTKGFPVFNADVMISPMLHIFGGVDGDIQRNTLTSFLQENQFLKSKIKLLNTEKTLEIYAGAKGMINSEFEYELKFSNAKYKNFYVFNNSKADTAKFEVLYDTLNPINQTTISALIGYQKTERWRSSLSVEINSFAVSSSVFEKAWHRPAFVLKWGNTVIFKKKLLVSTDLFLLSGIYGKNFVTNTFNKLPAIVDLNTKITYQLTEKFNAFVGLNNIFGKNYQRFTNYNQQGLNFVVGVSFSF